MTKVKIIINKENNYNNIYVYEDNVLVERYTEDINSKRLEGNIYLGKVSKVMSGLQAAFVDIGHEKNGLIHLKDIIPKVSMITGNENIDISNYSINDCINAGDKIIVQVKRDSADLKGAKLTKDIKLISKYVVLMPYTKFYTISKKIVNQDEKNRLLSIAKEKIDKIDNMGIIIRTSAENQDDLKIKEDIEYLLKLWKEINNKANSVELPTELLDYNGLVGKLITDFGPFDPEIETNSVEIKNQILKNYNIQKVVVKENILDEKIDSKIWLKCGGFIKIDETEALIAIDVNSGKYNGKRDVEETFFNVNKEAAIEIEKQLRLRDLGGIIVIDFIDMDNDEDREKIRQIFMEETKKDRSKVQVLEFTKLGLLELTRKQIFNK